MKSRIDPLPKIDPALIRKTGRIMDEIRDFFQNIISQSNTPDAEVIVTHQANITIDIDRALPLNDRLNRRSNILRFEYSEEFISDHPQVIENTPREAILRTINNFNFQDISHGRDENPSKVTFIITTNRTLLPTNVG